ncbi:MAG: hypothetical protein H6600_04295 [Flavobacteriales bacterium]|nr:hypothetical protein [Flavobacteriales bacterium]
MKNFLESKKGLWSILISIILINVVCYNVSNTINFPSIQKRSDASGFCAHQAKHFAYFYYYTGDFPLASLNADLKYDRQSATNEINENGTELIMEYEHWSRLGESARIWAFMPNAILKGSPEDPSIKLFNALAFTISLLILYFGLWRLKMFYTALLLVLLINFTPFFLYETYTNQNIFALIGSCFFLVFGLNVYALFKTEKLALYIFITIISAFIIGFFSEFRNEISIVIVSLFLFNLFTREHKFYFKILFILLSYGTFFGTKKIVRSHFDHKYEETYELVQSVDGHVYNGGKIEGHKLWHPIFCGLGDFDTKYGFAWNDKVAYQYAVPILQDKYGMDIHYSDKYHLDDYYDADSLYYIKFDEIEAYEEVVKDKVLFHIKNDPFWYFTIIIKRIGQTLTTTIPIPYLGWLLFPLVFILIKFKMWYYLKSLAISLPLSATSILIHSGKGATYNSIFVYLMIFCAFCIYQHVKTMKSKTVSV